MRQVVANLEKLKLPTAHSGSTGESTRHGSDDTARRPPSVKAALSVSFGQRAPHRASTRDSSPIRRSVSHPHERNSSDDLRRSPRSRHSQSREYSDKDWDRESYGDQSRARDRDQDHYRDRDRELERGRDQDSERDRYRNRDRDRERDRIKRDRERERDRERSHDYDRRSKHGERESSRVYDSRDSRHCRSRSRSRSRSKSRSLQAGTAQFESDSSQLRDGSKEKTSTSGNLAKLKDIYGDIGNSKGDANMERIPRRVNEGEEVIRLGGSTWKY